MSIKTYIAEKLFGAVIEQKVAERLPAASAGNASDIQWRRLSGDSPRELPVATWQRQVEVCYWLWKTNPLANWIIETLTTFTAGKGFTYTAKNDEVKKLLDGFWFDPVNRLDINLEQMVRELFLFGVQCWPSFRGEQTGRVRLGMIDPAQIVEIYADPQNAKILIGVKVRNLHSALTLTYRTILPGEAETVLSDDARRLREGWTDGECLLHAINRVSNDPYGTSDIFVLADWLDEYEEFVYNYSNKARKQNAYIWDVEIQGGDDATCQKFANDYAVKGDGELRAHNEKVKWSAVAPSLQAIELKESASVFRNHILGNKSIPEHWYGGGGNVNRNTASESNEPFFALVDSRQNLIKFIIESIFTHVIQSALDARYLNVSEEEAFDFAVNKPEATNRDLTKISTAVRDIVTAMVTAASQGWLDRENAVKMFAFVIALVGFELDPEDVLDAEPGYEDYQDQGSGTGDQGPGKTENAKKAPLAGRG
ncbi:hypothetical protein [Geobacter sp.]|uniref:hypothetical protein n=1 Tax=Geobacter sp. TaxID=46610 RepID=UPI0026360E74|nr:hypothetical protein [Geobacter sp.]